MRYFLTAAAFALTLGAAGVAFSAGQGAEARKAVSVYKKEAQGKLKANRAFLKAAEKIIEKGASPQADSFLSMAASSAEEGERHFEREEFRLAMEDFSESIQMAVSAIIVNYSQQDASVRDVVIHDEILLREKRDAHRKEALAEKGIYEVESFIKASEKLLKLKKDEAASEDLDHARAHFDSAKTAVMQADYDKALDDIKEAYKLSSGLLSRLKSAQGEIITFPKQAFSDEKELFSYELKKNDTYLYFAEQFLKDDPGYAELLKAAKARREEAIEAMNSGEGRAAISKIRSSTESYIKAVKGVSQ